MKTKIRIAEIPFLNSAPFYFNRNTEGLDFDIDWVWAHPKELGRMVLDGELDGGLFSLLDAAALEPDFNALPLGICARSHAQSVLMFSKVPFSELEEERLGLTVQSKTSVELLKVILRERFEVSPDYHMDFSPKDAARLVIGDQALFAQLDPVTTKEFPFRMDLGEEWKKWKGHSFVFARWMTRKSWPSSLKSQFQSWLESNLDCFEQTPGRVIELFEAAKGWKIGNAGDYLAGFKYRIEEKDYVGSLTPLSQFSSHLAISRS